MKIIQDLYGFFNDLSARYPTDLFNAQWKSGTPVPYIVVDNFLPEDLYNVVRSDISNIPSTHWTQFTRNGSYMDECNNLSTAPIIQTLTHCFNSGSFLKWLEGITDIDRLISDPKLVGAGLSVCKTGFSLKLHTDFNWNEQLHLNRMLSLIFYMPSEWNPEWGGSLEFWNFERTEIVSKIDCLPNRLLVWYYDDRLIHGYPTPLTSPDSVPRENLRSFYYKSNSRPIKDPHRSLYWWDENTKTAYDDRSKK
jgi:hypothetical protein